MIFQRKIKNPIINCLRNRDKVVIIYGPRQAGKTTLSKIIIDELGLKTLSINADQLKYIDVLSSRDLNLLKSLVAGYEFLFIDEGQRVPEIGINLKILHDEIPELKILVTGSSSFLLSERITESLTGRKDVFTLLPVSSGELSQYLNDFEIRDKLNEYLVYGQYPEVLNTENNFDKENYLREISESYIYKDILELENIKYPLKIRDILRLLAFQAGSQVSVHEIGKQLNLNNATVERYLHLLEQSFIIFKLEAFSTNPRKEISKSRKWFFYDNGIRNVFADNFNAMSHRNDAGALWENYIISERRKKLVFERQPFQSFFWRTLNGSEIDYVEKSGDQLFGYEIKFAKARRNPPKTWQELYGENFHCITGKNYLDFILNVE
jgi:uncharacterized protein